MGSAAIMLLCLPNPLELFSVHTDHLLTWCYFFLKLISSKQSKMMLLLMMSTAWESLVWATAVGHKAYLRLRLCIECGFILFFPLVRHLTHDRLFIFIFFSCKVNAVACLLPKCSRQLTKSSFSLTHATPRRNNGLCLRILVAHQHPVMVKPDGLN